MALMERHHLSHALGMADALIAATALTREAPLLTGNVKPYRMVEGLALETYTRR